MMTDSTVLAFMATLVCAACQTAKFEGVSQQTGDVRHALHHSSSIARWTDTEIFW